MVAGNPTIFTSSNGDMTLPQIESQLFGTLTLTGTTGTLNAYAGLITTGSLSIAAAAVSTFTITDSACVPGSAIFANVGNVSNTTGVPAVGAVSAGNGSFTVEIQNIGSAALSGTCSLSFKIVQP
jgi:hypothetical protein